MSITSDDPLEIEEERRLAYVGITRAREELTLTCARQRMTRGETQYNPVSRFVREIPPLLMDSTPAPVKRKREESYEENSREKSLLRTRPYAAPAPARTRQTPVGGRPFGGVGFGKPIRGKKKRRLKYYRSDRTNRKSRKRNMKREPERPTGKQCLPCRLRIIIFWIPMIRTEITVCLGNTD